MVAARTVTDRLAMRADRADIAGGHARLVDDGLGGVGKGVAHGDVKPPIGIEVEADLILRHSEDLPAQRVVPGMGQACDEGRATVGPPDKCGVDPVRDPYGAAA